MAISKNGLSIAALLLTLVVFETWDFIKFPCLVSPELAEEESDLPHTRQKRNALPDQWNYVIDVVVNVSGAEALAQLRSSLNATDLPIQVDNNTAISDVLITTVCSSNDTGLQCRCEEGYAWPYSICVAFGACDSTWSGICKCISGIPEASQTCQPKSALLTQVEYEVDVELNVSDIEAVNNLRSILTTGDFYLAMGPSVNVTHIDITTVCYPNGTSFQCRCEDQYVWSSEDCVAYGACDEITNDTCRCINSIPSDGHYCRPVTVVQQYEYIVEVEISVSDDTLIQQLRNALENISFPLRISDKINITQIDIIFQVPPITYEYQVLIEVNTTNIDALKNILSNITFPVQISSQINITEADITTVCKQDGNGFQCRCEEAYLWPCDTCAAYTQCEDNDANTTCSCIRAIPTGGQYCLSKDNHNTTVCPQPTTLPSTAPPLVYETHVSIEVNVSDISAVNTLRRILSNISYPIAINHNHIQIYDIHISTVCSQSSSGGYQCRCEDQYLWSCDQCLLYGSCDSIINDTCGCISAIPPDGQYCQPVDSLNITACPPTTTPPPPTSPTVHDSYISVELNVSDVALIHQLRTLLNNISYPVSISNNIQISDVNITAVCYPSGTTYQCRCEDQYLWSCDQCLIYGSCDTNINDTCGCINAIPPDGQYCQPVDSLNFTSCPVTTTTPLPTTSPLVYEYLLSVELNTSDVTVIQRLRNISFPIRITTDIQVSAIDISTVCSQSSSGGYHCRCEDRYRWSCDRCQIYGPCDSIINDTCGCISAIPSDGQYCQPVDSLNITACPPTTTPPPPTSPTVHDYYFSVELNVSDVALIHQLRTILNNNSYPVSISNNIQISDVNITTVCYPNGTTYQCRCEDQYLWSCDRCLMYGSCDNNINDTCGCINAIPPDGQYCQPLTDLSICPSPSPPNGLTTVTTTVVNSTTLATTVATVTTATTDFNTTANATTPTVVTNSTPAVTTATVTNSSAATPDFNTTTFATTPTAVTNSTAATTDFNTTMIVTTPTVVTNSTAATTDFNTTIIPTAPTFVTNSTALTTDFNTTIITTTTPTFVKNSTDMNTTTAATPTASVTNSTAATTNINTSTIATTPTVVTNSTPGATTDMNITTSATTETVTNSTALTTDFNTTIIPTTPTFVTNSTDMNTTTAATPTASVTTITNFNTSTIATTPTVVTNSTPGATTDMNITTSATTETVTNSTASTTDFNTTTIATTTTTLVTNSTPGATTDMNTTTSVTTATVTNSTAATTNFNTSTIATAPVVTNSTPTTSDFTTTPITAILTNSTAATTPSNTPTTAPTSATTANVTSQRTTNSSTTSEVPCIICSNATTVPNITTPIMTTMTDTTSATTTTTATTTATTTDTTTTPTTRNTTTPATTTTTATTPPTTTDTTTTATTTDTTTATTTTTTPTTTTMDSTSTPTATMTTAISPTPSIVYDLNMSMRLNLEYTPPLNDPSSPVYKNLKAQIDAVLHNQYKGLPGFNRASVMAFREGSVITDFVVQTSQVDVEMIAEFTKKLPEAMLPIAPVLGSILASHNSPFSISIPDLTYTGGSMSLRCAPPENFKLGPILSSSWKFREREISDSKRMKITTFDSSSVLEVNNVIPADSGLYSCTLSAKTMYFYQEGFVTEANIRQAPVVQLQSELNVKCLNGLVQPLKCCVQRPYTVKWFQAKDPLVSVPINDGESNCINHDYKIETCQGSQEDKIIFLCRVDNPSSYEKTTTMTIFIDSVTCDDAQYGSGRVGDKSSLGCDKGQEGRKTAECQATGTWKLMENTCIVIRIKELLIDSQDLVVEDVPTFVANLSQTVQEEQTAIANSSESITAIVDILDTIANVSTAVNESVMENVLETVDVIIGDDARETWVFLNENKTRNSSSRLLGSLETLSSGLTGKFAITTRRIQLNRTIFNNSFSADLNSSVNIDISNSSMSNVFITTILLSTFKNVMPTRNSTFEGTIFNTTTNQTITDNAINAAVLLVKINTTRTNVSLRYNKLNSSLTQNPQCVFWNFTLFNNLGAWDDQGCVLVSDINNTVTCSCNHLTSFSLLMAIDIPESLRELLDIMTYVGVGISLASLVICLIIEGCVWKAMTRNSTAFMRHVSIINTALSLLIADICFIIGASIANNPLENPGEDYQVPLGPCSTATFFMHFFYLALFFWMLVSGLLLCYRTVMVFSYMSKSAMLAIGFSLGYGCPLIIAVITVAVTAPGNGYIRKNDACWLNWVETKALLAMVIPALVIVFINILIVIVVLCKMLRRGLGDATPADEKHTLLVIARCVIILTPLFGLTWSLGVGTMVSSTNKGIHIAFAFFNSLQGFFILVFGTLLDSKTRSIICGKLHKPGTVSNTSRSTSAGFSSLSGTNVISRLLGRRNIYHVSQAANSNSSSASESFVNI